MNVDVPPWVSHGEQSVYSIDIDSPGNRVATAGSDAKVKVWNLVPLLSARAEEDESQYPKLLATLTDHCAPVNTVRFSGSGKLLATCSDDRVTFIYELHPGPGKTVFGSSDSPSLENWKPIHSLRGHSNNVMDVAWSPDDSMVATCSLDNSVIVWTAAGKQVAVLEGHSSYVKGISWDPIGSYLASQSDDKSVVVWRCSDWTTIQRITAPFQSGFLTQTFTLRLSWTTDGQYLVAPNSFQSPSHCAAVISRGDWACPLTVVGHRAAVTVVRFNPHLFRDPAAAEDEEPATCFALGSQDKRVTVWLSSGDRPRVIVDKLFSQSVADLAWAGDGHTLLACSTDGRVAVLRLEPGALGRVLTAEEQRRHMQSKYGDRPAGRVLLAESAAQLGLELSGTQPAAKQKPAAAAKAQRRVLAEGMPHPSEFPRPAELPTAPVEQQPRRTAAANGTGPEPPRAAAAAAAAAAALTTTTPPQTVRRAGEGPGPPAARGGQARGLALNPPPPAKALSVQLGRQPQLGGSTEPLCLEIANTGTAAAISCRCGANRLWADTLPGTAVAAAGSLNFSAVALREATLQVFTAGGRHLLPCMRLSSAVAHLCSDGGWRLLAVLLDGSLRLWDLSSRKLVAGGSVAALRGSDVVAARLSEGGSPLVLLADGSAHLLHLELQEWLQVVQPNTSGLPYSTTILPAAGTGELGALEAEARASVGEQLLPAPGGGEAARRQLEQRLAAARALGSPQEYRRWLLAYVGRLSGEPGEAARLREVCIELLGPLRGADSDWQPSELGLRKRDLLQEVLREAARQRTHQSLVAEFAEQLAATQQQ